MCKKGKPSVEYLIIVGVIMVALIPLFFYSVDKINSNLKINQADDTVNTLATAANIVHSLGPGTNKYVQITIPGGVSASTVNGTLIELKVNVYGSTSDFYATTAITVSGNIPTEKGTYTISVLALDDGTVHIGSYNDTTAPIITWTSPSGTLNVQEITLQANTNENSHCRYSTSNTAYTSMLYDFEGELLTHSASRGVLSAGNYTYYVRCKDSVGNIMQSSSTITFTLIVNSSSASLPKILLEGPANNTNKNFSEVKFTFNVTSTTADIAYCQLKITGVTSLSGNYDQSIIDSSIIEGTSQSLTTSLDRGNYTWYINCTDTSADQNTNISEKRYLRMNSTQGQEVFITSCSGWCGNSGFSNGICDNTISKCDDNCGLPYSGSSNCYAGSTVSTQYCLGGPESDTCCCIV